MNKEKYYNKVIVVDFDDTLCLHPEDDKSDIASGRPNVDLISKLNRLYDKGYHIHIYTARGHLSTNSRAEAEERYRGVILKWLNDKNVKFHLLSFNKPYGVIYIDDKAMRPDELHLLDNLT